MVTAEQVGMLRALLDQFQRQYDPETDPDPGSTADMVSECWALATVLQFQVKPEPTLAAIDPSEEIPF